MKPKRKSDNDVAFDEETMLKGEAEMERLVKESEAEAESESESEEFFAEYEKVSGK